MRLAPALLVLAALGCRPSSDEVRKAADACARYAPETNPSWECLARYGVKPTNCEPLCASQLHLSALSYAARQKIEAEHLECSQRLLQSACDQIYAEQKKRLGFDD